MRAISSAISLPLASTTIHSARFPPLPFCPPAIVAAAATSAVPPIERFIHASNGGGLYLSKCSWLKIIIERAILVSLDLRGVELSPHK
jgi:hypothetical protein